MIVTIVSNGIKGISLILTPDSNMEMEILKQLLKQENDMIIPPNPVKVLNQDLVGLIISKKDVGSFSIDEKSDENNHKENDKI